MRKQSKNQRSAPGEGEGVDRRAQPPVVAAEPAPVVILVEPQLGENIGAAARAMANFRLRELRLVRPRDGWPSEQARANASGADWIIDGATLYHSVRQAVADLNFVCATTARPRDMIKPVLTPSMAMVECHRRIEQGGRCGILFGPERVGLSNDDLALCDVIATAPVNPDFASLNLAQSVLIIAYEWLLQSGEGALGRRTVHDEPPKPGLTLHDTRPATREELVGFFEHLERELDASNFLRPAEKRPTMIRSIRNMFLRMGATEQDVRTLRGIVASLTRTHERPRRRS